jgi:hypothetical protein
MDSSTLLRDTSHRSQELSDRGDRCPHELRLGSGNDSKTLKVAYFGDPGSAGSLSKVAEPSVKTNPGIKVEFVGANGTAWNDIFTKLLTQEVSHDDGR